MCRPVVTDLDLHSPFITFRQLLCQFSKAHTFGQNSSPLAKGNDGSEPRDTGWPRLVRECFLLSSGNTHWGIARSRASERLIALGVVGAGFCC